MPAATVDEKPAAAGDAKPATNAAADNVPGGVAKPDMTPPAEVAPPTPKLPFEDLVAALGNEQANQFYRQVEQQLAQNPKDVLARLRLASLLNSVGMNLAGTGNREKGLEAFRAALEQAQSVAVDPQPKDVMARLQLASLLNSVGMNLAGTGNREKGLEAFRAALEQAQSVAVDPLQPLPDGAEEMLSMVYYNGACAQSLDGKPEDAKATLQKAIEMGFSDLNNLRNDADLAAVRALPGFDQQLVTWEALIAERLVKQAQEVLASGESFPFDFALTDFGGQAINLTGFQGKVLIVDIWGTWCPPCRAEIPSFVKLQTEYGPQGLQIVGLNYEQGVDEAAAKELVTKFIQENGMNYPCAMGTEAIQQQVPNFEGFPTTLFIDRAGKVRAKTVGLHEYAFLEAIVKILLAEAAPPPAAPTNTPPAASTDTPPAAPTDTPPADTGKTPADTPPADTGKTPADAPPSGGGTPPTDTPADPGK